MKGIFITAMLLTVCFAGKAKQDSVQQVVHSFFEALSQLDADKAQSYCTADVAILESGKVWNFDSLKLRIINRKKQSPDFKRMNTLNFIKTTVTGITASTYYLNHAEMTFSGKTTSVSWLESVNCIKQSVAWKINLLHSTELERSK